MKTIDNYGTKKWWCQSLDFLNRQIAQIESTAFKDALFLLLLEIKTYDFDMVRSIYDLWMVLNKISKQYGFITIYDGENIRMFYYLMKTILFKGLQDNIDKQETIYVQPLKINEEIYNSANEIVFPDFEIKLMLNGADICYLKNHIKSLFLSIDNDLCFYVFRKRLYDYLSHENNMKENKVGNLDVFYKEINAGKIPLYTKEDERIKTITVGNYGIRIYKKECPVCKKEFFSEIHNVKYCSEQCKKEAAKTRKASK